MKIKSKKNLGIAFLSNVLDIETYNFGLKIEKELGVNVYFINDSPFSPQVIVESPTFNPKNIIYIEDSICEKHGYLNCQITGQQVNSLVNKTPMANDKMLYYFCEVNLDVDFLFCFEYDVFIPSIECLRNLIKKYNKFDLVTPNNFKKTDGVLDWHWKNIIDKIEPPYYYSMICAMGISRNLLNCIKNYVSKNNSLFFVEAMFNTIAMQNNLKVKDAFELKSIVWLGDWGIDEFLLLPNNLFHPKKDLHSFGFYRYEIESKTNSKYKPKNKLPKFINDLL
jgi:hypothetical protein